MAVTVNPQMQVKFDGGTHFFPVGYQSLFMKRLTQSFSLRKYARSPYNTALGYKGGVLKTSENIPKRDGRIPIRTDYQIGVGTTATRSTTDYVNVNLVKSFYVNEHLDEWETRAVPDQGNYIVDRSASALESLAEFLDNEFAKEVVSNSTRLADTTVWTKDNIYENIQKFRTNILRIPGLNFNNSLMVITPEFEQLIRLDKNFIANTSSDKGRTFIEQNSIGNIGGMNFALDTNNYLLSQKVDFLYLCPETLMAVDVMPNFLDLAKIQDGKLIGEYSLSGRGMNAEYVLRPQLNMVKVRV